MNVINQKPSVLRPRTESMMNILPITSCDHRTFRRFSFDQENSALRNKISSKYQPRPIDAEKENVNNEAIPTPKQHFQVRKEKLKRPIRSPLKRFLPSENNSIPILNSFYESLDKLESELDCMDELWSSVTLPSDFFDSDEINIVN